MLRLFIETGTTHPHVRRKVVDSVVHIVHVVTNSLNHTPYQSILLTVCPDFVRLNINRRCKLLMGCLTQFKHAVHLLLVLTLHLGFPSAEIDCGNSEQENQCAQDIQRLSPPREPYRRIYHNTFGGRSAPFATTNGGLNLKNVFARRQCVIMRRSQTIPFVHINPPLIKSLQSVAVTSVVGCGIVKGREIYFYVITPVAQFQSTFFGESLSHHSNSHDMDRKNGVGKVEVSRME